LHLLDSDFVGYVGSRSISSDDMNFTIETVRKTVEKGYGVVSGGAKGVDTTAEAEALRLGGSAVAFLSDSMQRKIKSPETIRAIQEGRLFIALCC
jgi:Predicted Rossmann fold nucleotide-binding protein involved in DNA uptake